jgi:hypothetical protein
MPWTNVKEWNGSSWVNHAAYTAQDWDRFTDLDHADTSDANNWQGWYYLGTWKKIAGMSFTDYYNKNDINAMLLGYQLKRMSANGDDIAVWGKQCSYASSTTLTQAVAVGDTVINTAVAVTGAININGDDYTVTDVSGAQTITPAAINAYANGTTVNIGALICVPTG